MQIPVVVCDLDREVGRPTTSYTITQGDRSVTVDLCEEHADLLEQLLGGASSAPPVRRVATPAKKTAGRRPRGLQVTTLAEIEAMKAAKGS